MFELAPLGRLLAAVGLIYLLVLAPGLLPRRESTTTLLGDAAPRQFLIEAFVPTGSSLVGRPAREAIARFPPRGRLIEVVRFGRVHPAIEGEVVLKAGDRLRV